MLPVYGRSPLIGRAAVFKAGRRRRIAVSPVSLNRETSQGRRDGKDRRYYSARWRQVRADVLSRDNWTCKIVRRCPRPTRIVDHIIPVYPGMPDELFYGAHNLRAGCIKHNTERAVNIRLGRPEPV
jgi:5-methylcytosine-specific restriction endonuclease McrA